MNNCCGTANLAALRDRDPDPLAEGRAYIVEGDWLISGVSIAG